MKKKVGLLIPTLLSGGAERVVSRLSSFLNEPYEIFVILFEDTFMDYEYTGTLINLNIRSCQTSMPKKIFLPFKRARLLKKIKKQYQLDVVISFMDSPNIVNALSKTKKCKTVLSVRNYSQKEQRDSLLLIISNLMMKYLYKKADKIIPVSKVIGESLINHYKVQRNKIVPIYNPYDINQIKVLSNEMLDPSHEEFMSSGKIYISVGRQAYQKGFWHLIKAFKLVKDKISDAKLVIVGQDYQDGLVQKLVDELELHNDVLLVGYQKNPFKFIKKSDVYILTSLFEGFPNALVEAMACGIPVIAADCKSGPREILYENPNINDETKGFEKADFGLLIQDLSPLECWDKSIYDDSDEILSSAMELLISDKALFAHYSKKALERAQYFNYDICRQKFIDVIETI